MYFDYQSAFLLRGPLFPNFSFKTLKENSFPFSECANKSAAWRLFSKTARQMKRMALVFFWEIHTKLFTHAQKHLAVQTKRLSVQTKRLSVQTKRLAFKLNAWRFKLNVCRFKLNVCWFKLNACRSN